MSNIVQSLSDGQKREALAEAAVYPHMVFRRRHLTEPCPLDQLSAFDNVAREKIESGARHLLGYVLSDRNNDKAGARQLTDELATFITEQARKQWAQAISTAITSAKGKGDITDVLHELVNAGCGRDEAVLSSPIEQNQKEFAKILESAWEEAVYGLPSEDRFNHTMQALDRISGPNLLKQVLADKLAAERAEFPLIDDENALIRQLRFLKKVCLTNERPEARASAESMAVELLQKSPYSLISSLAYKRAEPNPPVEAVAKRELLEMTREFLGFIKGSFRSSGENKRLAALLEEKLEKAVTETLVHRG